jgi:gluconolactonase
MSTIVSPAPGFVVHAAEFEERVLGPDPRIVEVIATDAHEGPVYAADEDALYFTSVPRRSGHLDLTLPLVAVRRLALDGRRFPVAPNRLTTLRAPANAANGMTMDREGRLVMCEQGSFFEPAAITRLDRRTGAIETLVDSAGGLPLNSPNDVAVTGNGAIWFTDPSYGHLQGFRPEPAVADRVYRYDRSKRRLDAVAGGFDKPNGLVFSPGEDVLYVSDNGAPQHVVAFDVAGGRVTGRRVFAAGTPGHPDGLAVDADGRLYASAAGGIHVFSSGGERIGTIAIPGAVNFTFGGRERNILFVTADTSIWAVLLRVSGV